MKASAKAAESNKYKNAPMHRSSMPVRERRKALEINRGSPRNIILYVVAAVVIALVAYYAPDYSFLERATASHTFFLLDVSGIQVEHRIVGNKVFLDDFRIVRECTGIQVFAVFLGLLVPLPNASWKKKAVTIAVLSGILYLANVLRVYLEFWLVYSDLLPWILAHYPLSLLLGVFGVASLVLITDRLLPEFGNFVFYIFQRLLV